MKKVKNFLLLLTIAIMLAGCANNESQSNGDGTQESQMSAEEARQILDAVVSEIKVTDDYCNSLAALIYEYWDYNGYECFFDYEEFQRKDSKYNSKGNYNQGSFYGDAKRTFEYRDEISSRLGSIKSKLKEVEDVAEVEDYYDAVKALYLNVDAYSSFASDFPEGYSKLTYSKKFAEHQDEFESLLSEVEFEQ